MHLMFGGSGVMEKFCLKCGAVANETATNCPSCGALLGQPAASAYPQAAAPPPPPQAASAPQTVAPPQNYPPQSYAPQASYAPGTFPPAPSYPQQSYPMSTPPKKSNSAVKWIVGILVTLFVLFLMVVGIGYYAFHKVKNKFEAISAESQQEQANVTPLKMPVCSLLSAADVSAAIGVPIVSAEANDANACVYTAKGTADDMASKHMSAVMKQNGGNAQQQQMMEQFSSLLKPKKQDGPVDPNATTPVLMMDVDAEDARVAMKMFKSLLGNQPGAQKITIGDEAFDASGSVLMVMKNGHLIRFTYATCPCGTDAMKPLAKKVADQL
jgi:hypothetical protein